MGRTACKEPQCLYKGALHLLPFSPVTIIPPLLINRISYIYHRCNNLTISQCRLKIRLYLATVPTYIHTCIQSFLSGEPEVIRIPEWSGQFWANISLVSPFRLLLQVLLYVMYIISTLMSCTVALSDDLLYVTSTTEIPLIGVDSWVTWVIWTDPPPMWRGWPSDSSTEIRTHTHTRARTYAHTHTRMCLRICVNWSIRAYVHWVPFPCDACWFECGSAVYRTFVLLTLHILLTHFLFRSMSDDLNT